jgi:hypothetical protein
VASVLVYAVLAAVMTERVGEQPIGLPGMAVALLVGLAVLDLLLAPVIERALFGKGGGNAAGLSVEDAIGRYGKAKLVGFAFREAAAVLGLLLFLFTGRPAWAYALAAATLVAMALAWPSRRELERVVGGPGRPR